MREITYVVEKSVEKEWYSINVWLQVLKYLEEPTNATEL